MTGFTMTNKNFHDLFGNDPRDSKKDVLTEFHMDIAASIQEVTEEVMIKICKSLQKEYKIPNLCLAGGVALNCVANGKIHKEKIFENIWVQPAAGDAGGSIGAALAYWHIELNQQRDNNGIDKMKGSYLGPEFDNEEIEKRLINLGAKFHFLNDNELIDKVSTDLCKGLGIGWFQGRMEFGPRALGNRSIIGDPRSETMQKTLNLKVKYRESFRPFAPSVLREDVKNWFEFDYDSPYMLMVSKIKKEKQKKMSDDEKKLFGINKLNVKRSDIPAVTHVDYSARIQTVHIETNKKYHNLIRKFKEKTGCPVIVKVVQRNLLGKIGAVSYLIQTHYLP